MDKLKRYLNSLPVVDQTAYAERCKTTIGYLRKAISRRHRLDGALCRLLDEESSGAVPRGSLRADIWPLLSKRKRQQQAGKAA